MRTAPKVTLIVGAVMLVASILAVVVGIGSTDLDFHANSEEIFAGDAPTDWEGELDMFSIYLVYVEEGSNVSAEIVGGNEYNRFVSCSEDYTCSDSHTQSGYSYIGYLSVENDGFYRVEFSGEGNVLVAESEVEVGGLLAAGIGFWCGCCSVLILIVGLIMALVMKDNVPAQILVMPQGGGQVSFAAQPASYTPGQPVVMNQEVSFQPPLQSDQPWEPPQSGS
ncbi:MAG: hypothetical protein VX828_02025 [Candidatus Thermoplasmatota archaeon]|nr:hypothetical protein [Candidatus Thermoplasmatota archaeon]